MLKFNRTLIAVACAGLALAACQKHESKSAELTNDAQKFSYSIGIDLANSLQPVIDDVDLAALKNGLDTAAAANAKIKTARDALAKDPSNESLKTALAEAEKKPDIKLDDAAREQVKNTVAEKIQKKQVAERTATATKSKEEGDKFLAENGKKAGVKTTASGLQYEVIKEGTGTAPKASDSVTVHYKGTLLSGETFDSSYDRGQPVTFPLQNVIPGWTEGLQLMKTGAKYKFAIPSNLAYGERGAGVKIGPNATLVFEVELISIGDAKPAAAAGEKKEATKK